MSSVGVWLVGVLAALPVALFSCAGVLAYRSTRRSRQLLERHVVPHAERAVAAAADATGASWAPPVAVRAGSDAVRAVRSDGPVARLLHGCGDGGAASEGHRGVPAVMGHQCYRPVSLLRHGALMTVATKALRRRPELPHVRVALPADATGGRAHVDWFLPAGSTPSSPWPAGPEVEEDAAAAAAAGAGAGAGAGGAGVSGAGATATTTTTTTTTTTVEDVEPAAAKATLDGSVILEEGVEDGGAGVTLSTRPVVLVLHGLVGSSRSKYVRQFSAHLLRRGFRVCCLVARGCGDTPLYSPRAFTAAHTDDVARAIAHIRRRAPRAEAYFGVGFSLGANLLSKYLGEIASGVDPMTGPRGSGKWTKPAATAATAASAASAASAEGAGAENGASSPVASSSSSSSSSSPSATAAADRRRPLDACVMVSCPFDLGTGVKVVHGDGGSGPNTFLRILARDMHAYFRRHESVLARSPLVDPAKVYEGNSLREYERAVVLNLHPGLWDTVADYHDEASCCHVMQHIDVPSLYLNAIDDPVVPPTVACTGAAHAQHNPNLGFVFTASGGHIAFLTNDTPGNAFFDSAWCDLVASQFFEQALRDARAQ